MIAFNMQSTLFFVALFLLPCIYLLLWCLSKNNVARYVYPLSVFLPCVLGIFVICEGIVSLCVPVPRSIIFGRVYTYGIWNANHLVSSLSAALCTCVVKTLIAFALFTFSFDIAARVRLQKIEAQFITECSLSSYMAGIAPVFRRAQKRKERQNIIAIRTQLYYGMALFQQGGIQEAVQLEESLLTSLESLKTSKAIPLRITLLLHLSTMYYANGESSRAKRVFAQGENVLAQFHSKNRQVLQWIQRTNMSEIAQKACMDERYEEAAAIWEEQLSVTQPGYNQVVVYCQLANAYHKLGQTELAFHHYHQAENIAPDFYSVRAAKKSINADI